MLKKQYRLRKDSAFNATYRIRHSYCVSGVVLWVGKKKRNDGGLVNPPYGADMNFPTKVGFVVSKKTHKRAVKRNRLKRLMRESYRVLQQENALGKSQEYMSLIFVGFEKALGKDFNEMKDIVHKLLIRIEEKR